MEPIQFYKLPGCPYCAKVERVLDELEVPYETIEVPPSHGDREMVEQLTGRTQVPVIVDQNNGIDGMDESDRIVEYLQETYS